MKKVIDFSKDKKANELYQKIEHYKNLLAQAKLRVSSLKSRINSYKDELWEYAYNIIGKDTEKCKIEKDGIYQLSFEDNLERLKPLIETLKNVFGITNDNIAENIVKEFLRDNDKGAFNLLYDYMFNNFSDKNIQDEEKKSNNIIKFPSKEEL